MTKKALLPAGWPRPRGYANGVTARGRTIFVAGMIGWNERGEFETDSLAGQARQALANIAAVLAADGARPAHIVRMTWYVTDKREYLAAGREVGQAFRELPRSFRRTTRAARRAESPTRCRRPATARRTA